MLTVKTSNTYTFVRTKSGGHTTSEHAVEKRIILSPEQAERISQIITELQQRQGMVFQSVLECDDEAREALSAEQIDDLPTGRINLVRLVKEPPAPALRRRAVIVPILLLLLLGIAIGLLLGTPQGTDLILTAEDGWSAAIRLAVTLMIIPAPLLAALTASIGEDFNAPDYDGRNPFLNPGAWATAVVGALAAYAVNALQVEPLDSAFGVTLLPLVGAVALSGFGIYAAFQQAIRFPLVSAPVAAFVLVAIGAWPAQIGSFLGSPLLLATMLSAWALLLSALIHYYRRVEHSFPFWMVFALAVVAALVSHLSNRHAVVVWPLWLTLPLLAAALVLILLRTSVRGFRYWMTGLVIAFGVILTFWTYEIGRPVDMMRGAVRSERGVALDKAVDDLLARQAAQKMAPVIVIVAASGGGIKASYWTSKVLSQATDLSPSLRGQLLAASGVSGGSLGLALYRSLLDVPSPRCDAAKESGPIESCVAAFHRQDLLAGLIGAYGTSEIANFVLPVFPRRSVALEKAWEERWSSTVRDADGQAVANVMARPFSALWQGKSAAPALILNTTRPRVGDRIVLSNLDLARVLQPPSSCGANIAEHLDMPLSTAANASARFPVVEEWGWFRVLNPAMGCASVETIADGGFYDNYGAATALDLYQAVKARVKDRIPAPKIIVVQISSDVDCRLAIPLDDDPERKAECDARAKKRREELGQGDLPSGYSRKFFLNAVERDQKLRAWQHDRVAWVRKWFYSSGGEEEAKGVPVDWTPPGMVGTMMNAVSVNGLTVASRLRETVKMNGDRYFHFSLGGAFDIPLGWSLSRHAIQEIDVALEDGTNCRAMAELVRELSHQPQMPKCRPSRAGSVPIGMKAKLPLLTKLASDE
ncbi:hypothetical protein G6L29_30315 [Agrobacterium rhizogenes]|uniref:hypothetical protein n=1 Tax=Rhizobium rhizogenes TaxID=359 RepID=UPI0004D6AA5D|nr:hypothetical protein [Rhizobium rhizogenes]KEA07735.1 hypothetical protein CN09_00720 [Rhizobium rhizogenes]MQB34167.1 hypothetical protein [Rhizobium rhizogenes]NTF72526.1 hypothetical protein [Rhizobium rhizogenes]NTH23086.1 hypothetical protein [Rhizobium rhizogenes]NTH36116.1 hypothetical protein [Rhizobium rhizogenes]